MKHRYTAIADTPILIRAKKAYLQSSDVSTPTGYYHSAYQSAHVDIFLHVFIVWWCGVRVNSSSWFPITAEIQGDLWDVQGPLPHSQGRPGHRLPSQGHRWHQWGEYFSQTLPHSLSHKDIYCGMFFFSLSHCSLSLSLSLIRSCRWNTGRST